MGLARCHIRLLTRFPPQQFCRYAFSANLSQTCPFRRFQTAHQLCTPIRKHGLCMPDSSLRQLHTLGQMGRRE